MERLKIKLDRPGDYTFKLFNEEGVNVLKSVESESDLVKSLLFVGKSDAKVHLYIVNIEEPGRQAYRKAIPYMEGGARNNQNMTGVELCNASSQKILIGLGNVPSVISADYKVFDYHTGDVLLNLPNKNVFFDTIVLPQSRVGSVFISAVSTDPDGGKSYNSVIVPLTGCSVAVPTTTQPVTTAPSTSVALECWEYSVTNTSGSAQIVLYVNCVTGELEEVTLQSGFRQNICSRAGGIRTYVEFETTNYNCGPANTSVTQPTTTQPPVTIPSTSSSDFVKVEASSYGFWQDGKQFVQYILSYNPASIGPFDYEVYRQDNGALIGQAINQQYPGGGFSLQLANSYVGEVTIQVRAKKGTTNPVDDALSSRNITLPAAPVTTSAPTTSATVPPTTSVTQPTTSQIPATSTPANVPMSVIYAQNWNGQEIIKLEPIWENGLVRYKNTANPNIPSGQIAYYIIDDNSSNPVLGALETAGPFPAYYNLSIIMHIAKGTNVQAQDTDPNYYSGWAEVVVYTGYQDFNTPIA